MEIALIDHYDSFTHNVIDWLECRNNSSKINRIAFDNPSAMAHIYEANTPIVISPGPKSPKEASETERLIKAKLGQVPILGICLGHQILGSIAGATITHCQNPVHGQKRKINITDNSGFFSDFPSEIEAAVYNSLTLEASTLKPHWKVTARCKQNEVQAIEYRAPNQAPAIGVQFHPESFLTEQAELLLKAWEKEIKPNQ